jgi:hypothetical protein
MPQNSTINCCNLFVHSRPEMDLDSTSLKISDCFEKAVSKSFGLLREGAHVGAYLDPSCREGGERGVVV